MGFIADIKLLLKLHQVEKQTGTGANTVNIRSPLVTSFNNTWGKPSPFDFNRLVDSAESWSFVAAYKNGFSVAKVPLKLFQEIKGVDGQTELKPITDHPFLDLMKTINPFFNRFEILAITQIFLEITGNAYWWLVKDNLGIPRELWYLPSHWVQVIPSKTEFVAGYIMRVPGEAQPVPFAADEVIQFKFPTLHDPHYGTPPMFGAIMDVDLNKNIKTYGINFMKNDARPSGILSTEKALTEPMYNRLMTAWRLKYGGSKNAGKIAILEKGLKYQQIGSGLGDINFPDAQRSVRDGILAAFGVPASKLGLVEDVNRANAEAADFTYQNETIVPRLILLEEKLNEKFIPLYDSKLVVKFDNPVPKDKEFRLKQQTEHIKSGYSAIDDERKKDSEEPYKLPETQTPLIPFNLVPAGGSPAGTQPASAPRSIEVKASQARKKWEVFAQVMGPQERFFGDKMRRFFQSERRIVMNNINRVRSFSKGVKAGVEANIIFNVKEENLRLATISRPNIDSAYRSGLEIGFRELDAALDFSLIQPNITRAIDKRISFFAEKVNGFTVKLLTKEINAGVQAGESIDQISKRVGRVYDHSEAFRSRRIAQTEVIGSANDGQLQAYIENNVDKKIWLTARDERVRDSHISTEGQIVGVTEDFTLGSGVKIQYPGDRGGNAPAGEVINCRCTVQPIVEK